MGMLNRVTLIGNLPEEPKLIEMNNVQCKFTVLTSEKFTTKDGKEITKVQNHRITAWGRLAETCIKYLDKGSQVYVEGKLEYSIKDDPITKERKYFTDIILSNIQFLSYKKKEDTGFTIDL